LDFFWLLHEQIGVLAALFLDWPLMELYLRMTIFFPLVGTVDGRSLHCGIQQFFKPCHVHILSSWKSGCLVGTRFVLVGVR
jgi:hypothetical protein